MIVEQWQQMYGSSQLWYCVPAPWGALSGLCSIFKGGMVGGVAGTLICGPILEWKRGSGDWGGGGVCKTGTCIHSVVAILVYVTYN